MRVVTSLINASRINITCNHLNLPTSILWGTAKKIDIVYDAVGGQLSRTVYTGAVVDYKQDYAAGVEYRTVGSTRKLESIAHAEGRRYNVNVNTGTSTESLRIEYSIRDHLGNNRLTFTDKNSDGKIDVTTTSTNEILSEQHYYPFGLSYGGNLWMNEAGDVDNRYLYNGKELMGDHGLGWYAYGARYFDPALGRFTGVDPIADQFPHVTTYNYAENEPIANIDLHGLQKHSMVKVGRDDSFLEKAGKFLTILRDEWVGSWNDAGNAVGQKLSSLPLFQEGNNISAEDYHDSANSKQGVEGFEVVSNTEKKANGILDTNAGTASKIVEENTLTAAFPDAGGIVGEASSGTKVANFLYNIGISVTRAEQASENLKGLQDKLIVEPVDSVCNSCKRPPHGKLPYVRFNATGNPIDTITPERE